MARRTSVNQLALFRQLCAHEPINPSANPTTVIVEPLAASRDEHWSMAADPREGGGGCAGEVPASARAPSSGSGGATRSDWDVSAPNISATSADEVVDDGLDCELNDEGIEDGATTSADVEGGTSLARMLKVGLDQVLRNSERELAKLEALNRAIEQPQFSVDLTDVVGKVNSTGLTLDDWLHITNMPDSPRARACWAADYDAIEVMFILRGQLDGRIVDPPPPLPVTSPPFPPNTIGAIILPPPSADGSALVLAPSARALGAPNPRGRSHVRRETSSAAAPSRAGDPLAVAMRRITDRQRELLGQLVVVEDRAVFGSDEHIDDWAALKDVVKLLGGTWKTNGRGKKGGFVFPDGTDVMETIWLARERGEVFDPKMAGFFATSAPVADELVAKVPLVPRSRVIEPNAGTGNIVAAVMRACPTAVVSCVELLENHQRILAAAGHVLIGTDFLKLDPASVDPFDAAIMNPPFGNSGDVKHVLHAVRFVRPAGHLAAIISPGIEHRATTPYIVLRRWVDRHGGEGRGGKKRSRRVHLPMLEPTYER